MRRVVLPLALTLAILAGVSSARGQEYYSQEKCSLCHIRESVFFAPGFAPAEVLKGFGEERVCFSCHNGAVRDSRDVLWRGAQHPPAAGAGPDGKRCSPCHSPHAKGGWSVLAGTSIPIRGGGDALCAKCHGGYERSAGSLHRSGFPDGGCGECHRAHGGSGKALLRDARGAICARCHPEAEARKGRGHPVARPASATGAGKPLPECVACHPVHRKAGGEGIIDQQCAGCHDVARRPADAATKRHVREESCTTCHSFHASATKKGKGLRRDDVRADLLCGSCHSRQVAEERKKAREKGTHPTRSADGGKDLCFRCHRIHGAVPGTALLVSEKQYSCLECHEGQNTISEIAGMALAHPVFERLEEGRLAATATARRLTLGAGGEIVCRTCHSVHGAAAETPLLAAGSAGDGGCLWCHEGMGSRHHMRPGMSAVGPDCGTCHPVHGKKAPAAAAGQTPDVWGAVCTPCHPRIGSPHGPGTAGKAEARPPDLPGFDGRGRAVRTGAMSCPTCHDPHGPPQKKRLRRQYEPSAFVCTACHREKESVALTPHDLRGVSGKSICEPCHWPHGGKQSWMWGISADEGEAEQGPAAACRACHKDGGMAKPIGSGGHPVNVLVPRPIPQVYPLFGAVGERIRNGVLTCATCHAVHGSGLPASGGEQGADTGMLLRPGEGADGGGAGRIKACLPCHQGKQATHGQADCIWCHPPHAEQKSEPDCWACHTMGAKGNSQAHIARSQGCGACHRIHAAKGDAGGEAVCIGCHPKKGNIVGTVHGELEGGPCGTCHPAHEARDDTPVRRRAWEEIFVPDLPCLRCHREGGMAPAPARGEHPKSRKKVPTNYGAVVTLETPIAMVGRLREGGNPLFPLYDDAGGKGMSGQLGCLSCHDPHAGNTIEKKGDRRAAKGYLRDPSGAFLAEMCAPCHRGSGVEHARKFHELPRKSD